MAGGRTQGQRDRRTVQSQSKHVPIEFDLSGEVNVEFAARGDEAVTLGAEQLGRSGESEPRKCVEQRQLGAWFRQHEV